MLQSTKQCSLHNSKRIIFKESFCKVCAILHTHTHTVGLSCTLAHYLLLHSSSLQYVHTRELPQHPNAFFFYIVHETLLHITEGIPSGTHKKMKLREICRQTRT